MPKNRARPPRKSHSDSESFYPDVDYTLLRRAVAALNILTPGRMPILMDAMEEAFRAQLHVSKTATTRAINYGAARGITVEPPPSLMSLPDGGPPMVPGPQRPLTPGDINPEFLRNRVAMASLQGKSAEVALRSLVGRHAYYATEEMTALIAAGATRSVEDLALTVTDLPSPDGFAYLHRPDDAGLFLWWTVVGDSRVAAALSSSSILREWLSLDVADLASMPSPFAMADLSGIGTDDAPRSSWVTNPFKDKFGDDEDLFRRQDAQAALPHLFSFVHMLRQEFAEDAAEQLPPVPVSDKRGKRKMRRDRVSYLSVRRRVSGGATGRSGREYSVRWVVRGHWRRQWYATQNRHIPIWIMDHIAGPDDAPLVTNDKVTVVKQPPGREG